MGQRGFKQLTARDRKWLQTQPAEVRKTKTYWTHFNAQYLCDQRRWRSNQKRRRKLPRTRKWVVEKLRQGWSPQQIAGRSRLEGVETVSHEYVYALLHRDKKRGGRLYRLLKRFGKRKQRLGDRDYTPFPSGRFTHPYSSTERGSIENLNGLVRYYLPKRSSFATLTQNRLDQIEELLNHRPRKCLGYLTPHEVHSKRRSLHLRLQRCI